MSSTLKIKYLRSCTLFLRIALTPSNVERQQFVSQTSFLLLIIGFVHLPSFFLGEKKKKPTNTSAIKLHNSLPFLSFYFSTNPSEPWRLRTKKNLVDAEKMKYVSFMHIFYASRSSKKKIEKKCSGSSERSCER